VVCVETGHLHRVGPGCRGQLAGHADRAVVLVRENVRDRGVGAVEEKVVDVSPQRLRQNRLLELAP
jgi:hypothetical protein